MRKISIEDFELDLVSSIEAPITIWGDSGKVNVSLVPKELDEEEYEELSDEEEMEMFIETFNSYLDRIQSDAEYVENNKEKVIEFLIKEKIYDNLEDYIKTNKKDCIKFEEIFYQIDDDEYGYYSFMIVIKAEGEDMDNRSAFIQFDENYNMTFDSFIGGKEIKGEVNNHDFFKEGGSEFTINKDITDEDIRNAEERLGYKLPQEYIDLIKVKNGGVPKNQYFITEEKTSWGTDYIHVDALFGIGDEENDEYTIKEWTYEIAGIKGIVIAPYISDRKAVIILNYSNYLGGGEPEVAYVDAEYQYEANLLVSPKSLAKDFKSFMNGLVSEEEMKRKMNDNQ